MKCIILAAGYATRLYPLTQNFPKPLLEVKGKTIIDWIYEDIQSVVDEIVVVSNHKFVNQFTAWAKKINSTISCDALEKSGCKKITVIDDGSTDNDNRLGAVRDIAFAIESCGIDDDTMVLAGDNLLDFSLKGFASFYNKNMATCIMRHYEDDINKLKRTGVVVVDDNSHVLQMQEKPQEPASNWAVPPFYIYPKTVLGDIVQAVKDEVCNVDAPGSFIEWFCKEHEVYAYEMPGKRYDICDKNSLNEANEIYPGVII